VRAFADALREEERPHGVRVSTVYPGRVATNMQRELRDFEGGEYDEADYLRPESVAAAVRFALTAPAEASVEDLSIRPR
jgi:NADP-dependent 3-hydroxy acid dehydrogenase YdfG